MMTDENGNPANIRLMCSRKHPHLPDQVAQGLVVLGLGDRSALQKQIQGVLLAEEEFPLFVCLSADKKAFPREEAGIDRFNNPVPRGGYDEGLLLYPQNFLGGPHFVSSTARQRNASPEPH